MRPGALIPYHATLGLSVNAPVLGVLRLPLEKEGQLPVPAPPEVSVTSVTWKNLTLAGATGLLKLKVGNPNSFAFNLAGFDYDFKLGGFELAKGGLTHAASLAAGAVKEIGINLSVSTAQAGLAILRMVEGRAAATASAAPWPSEPLSAPCASRSP